MKSLENELDEKFYKERKSILGEVDEIKTKSQRETDKLMLDTKVKDAIIQSLQK